MDIEDEFRKLPRERALKIISDLLVHFSIDRDTKLVIATADIMSIRRGSGVPIFLIAPAEKNLYQEEQLQYVEEGCQFGGCLSCKIELRSDFKHVSCPLCGTPLYLS